LFIRIFPLRQSKENLVFLLFFLGKRGSFDWLCFKPLQNDLKRGKNYMEEDHRPWGYYRVLADEPDHKVKRIIVHAGKRLSLQRHRHREEHWYILCGQALVTRDNEKISLSRGEAVDIPKGVLHRIENVGSEPVGFIEVQTGTYFGEDDIERVEDDFGRI
jgi:mannose-6-phosphate isomerase